MMVRENDRFDQRELRVRRSAANRDARDVQRSARGEQRAVSSVRGMRRSTEVRRQNEEDSGYRI